MKRQEQLLSRWGRYLLPKPCNGCLKRRAAIKKLVKGTVGASKEVAVMFSGGLDSTYAAYTARQAGHKVSLFHVRWLYASSRENEAELKAAERIADWLKLPLHVLGEVWIAPGHVGNIMRVPIIGSMIICHRKVWFEVLATGLAPGISERDLSWHKLLEATAENCMPGLELWHPRGGILRSKIELPEELREMTFSRIEKGDDQ